MSSSIVSRVFYHFLHKDLTHLLLGLFLGTWYCNAKLCFYLMLSKYGNTILLCLILYPLATSLNSLFNFNNLSVDFLTIWRPESSHCYCYHRCLWNHSLRPRNRRPDTECGALPPRTPASQQQSPPPFYFPDPTHAHLIGRYSPPYIP